MGAIIAGLLVTLLFGGLVFGILLSFWTRRDRDMMDFFLFWAWSAVSGWFLIEGWAGIL